MRTNNNISHQTNNQVLFDADFIDELCDRFTLEELRREEHAAEIHISTARAFGEDAEEGYFQLYGYAERYTPLKKAEQTFKGLCPFHSEKTPSFFVYPKRQSWHCFGACNTGGDVISFVMKTENTDFKGAIAILAGK